MNNNVWLKMKPKTHQRSKPKSRFEELDQVTLQQDLQSPSHYGLYSDPCTDFCTDFCSLIGIIVSLVIAISVCFWLMTALSYNALKALSHVNRTLDISLVNFTNNSLSLNESFY